ncbi:trypsin-like peptidase domain-containing protein [Saccharothrix australiensis]|nr:trypsin-like peptidase domain-containing protein [Saccharothrix australiensis]
MPAGALPTSVARFVDGSGRTVGAGVVVSRRHLFTCAHVVNLALDRDARDATRPRDHVRVEFAALPGLSATATVRAWAPPPPREGAPGEDICVLALAVPATVTPAGLISTPPPAGHPVDVFGFPANRPDGAWVRAVVRGQVAGRLLQLDSESALRVQTGYSGGPVWDPETGRVVGIIATAAAQDSYAIPAERLRAALPDHPHDVRRDRITVLHLGSTRFGADEQPWRTGKDVGSRHTGADDEPWYGPLHAAVDGVRPDLVVFSGDLTEHARPSEFQRGFRFLAHLAEAVELPRGRVVVVPGARDVNLPACRAYFAHQEALEREPVWPFWPKWGPFATAFDEFYGGVATFTPDEPWSLFEVPDLSVVVAALNSTLPVSHLGSGADVGDPQVDRFNHRLREYRQRRWLRIGVAHGPLSSRHQVDVHLVLTGEPAPEPQVPLVARGGAFQVLAVEPDGYRLAAHRYDPDRRRWVGDTRVDPDGTGSVVHVPVPFSAVNGTFSDLRRTPRAHPPGPARDTFFDRVHEATVVSHPTATVTPRPESRYLRVSKPRAGGGFEQWPVGVADGSTLHDDVEAFIGHVHLSFAAADPSVPSELVYSGPPAAPDLVASARRRGVRLRSFVEYQGLLDLRPLVQRQAQRLAADLAYPDELYVPQRYSLVGTSEVCDDVLARVIGWLGRESARFVVVLGDFGRGKSFLLRQLTRNLPDHLPGLLPVLVELRSLEKAPTLDELLAQHLVREGVEAVDVAKLRYMIGSGRLALLFDGFDELELRVGYDHAADYLGTLLHAVTDRAKVVLTSRTQHFRSTNQVLTALGQQVSALTGSRGVVLADFADDQIREFLTRHYGGDADRADRRFALLGGISDLLGLSRNPRMLSFIADLAEDRLLEIRRRHGRISAAELYRELVDFWLVHEARRQRHRFGRPSLDDAERLAACTALALRLWESTASTVRTADLADAVVTTLNRLAERGYSIDQAAHAVGSGTLLVRTEDGGFAFVHQSVMEWLVAKVAADDLLADRPDTTVFHRTMSPLMVDFFCDLAGHDAAVRWARSVLADPGAGEVPKRNATAVVQRLDVHARLELAGVDLRATDLSALDLRGANLKGADLSGQRLVDKDLTAADLSGADLSRVRMFGGDLTDAVLTGSTWRGAALLGVRGTDRPELADAAVSGRDPASAMVAPLAEDVAAVAFSPGGGLAALARVHGVELRDSRSNRPVRFWRRHAHPVVEVAYSPDGRLLATVEEDGSAFVWDATTDEPVARLVGAVRGPLTFLADRVHLVGLDGEGRLTFWVARTGDVRDGVAGAFERLAVTPDGVWAATATADGDIRTWAVSGEVAQRTTVGAAVRRIAIKPGAEVVAVATEDGAVELVETGWGLSNLHLEAEPGVVDDLAYSPDGTLLAIARRGTDVVVLNATTGAEVAALPTRVGACRVAFTPDSRRIAVTVDDGSSVVHEIGTEKRFPLSTGWRTAGPVAFTSKGSLITSYDHHVRVWHLGSGVVAAKTHVDAVDRVTFAPNGMRAATTTAMGIAVVWPLHGLHEPIHLDHPSVRAVAFSHDGEQIVTWSSRGVLRTWNSHTGDPLGIFRGGDMPPASALAHAPWTSDTVSGHEDGTLRLWRLPDVTPIVAHEADVECLAYAPGGGHFASGSTDGTVKVWKFHGGLRATMTVGRTIWGVAFSPDGDRVAAASSDGLVRVWGLDGDPLLTLTGHTARVVGVAFSRNGRHIASTSDDGTARIWDAATGAELATFVHGGEGEVVLLPDGSYKNVGAGPVDEVFWSVKQCRFRQGELDRYYPEIRALAADEPLPGLS